jgi:hypothetical protein
MGSLCLVPSAAAERFSVALAAPDVPPAQHASLTGYVGAYRETL